MKRTDEAEAGWKFWKKKKDDTTTTTEAPGGVSGTGAVAPVNPENVGSASTGSGKAGIPLNSPSVPNTSNPPAGPKTGNASPPGSPSIGTRGAIAGAANPGLAVGVANSGSNIRNNARPQRPNPGTEVGLDGPGPRPAKPGTGGTSGQDYRDFAVDLTGAGDGTKPAPKIPAAGPVLTRNGGQQPAAGKK